MPFRKASHAGTWYSNNVKELGRQLDGWLQVVSVAHRPARAIIAPHAGYSYCGACAAFAYKQVDPSAVKRIFVLGPSHNVWLPGCALSSTTKYCTPFYDLTIDSLVYSELEATGQFERMSVKVDEDEHSLEMHLPYIARVMEEYKDSFTIVPIMIGSLTVEREATYGQLLAPYLADPNNLFVVSSDFCHWGQRFRYTYHDQKYGQIFQSVEALDKMGMDCIEDLNPNAFSDYLKKYDNTICGRHPIAVLLQAASVLEKKGNRMSLKFLKYAQSDQCFTMSDSSVSYASASLTFI
ncbi:protein MEMO1-like [Frankliniella occidentalis]|uniref:Protein MEMO1-like n=1 Tax=Frankliniella occidentalis TaxID=133901 RepID=A0A6J1TNK7_FRAOC|nr:protein MEMO1-like [Frankliniella occidentalis]